MAKFDKVITWGDSSKEHVVIDDDGFVRLNGIKRHLLGMHMANAFLPNGLAYYHADNLTLLNTELATLASNGMRICFTDIGYAGLVQVSRTASKACYRSWLQKFYDNKMLVIVGIVWKNTDQMDDLATQDFTITGAQYADTFSQSVTDMAEVIAEFPNVIATCDDFELDYIDPGRSWNATLIDAHLDLYIATLDAVLTGVPHMSKLLGGYLSTELAIKQAVMALMDIQAFDIYHSDAIYAKANYAALTDFLNTEGFSRRGWWLAEHSGYDGANAAIADYTTSMTLDAFKHGAAVAILFESHWSANPTTAWFNDNGTATAALTTALGALAASEANEVQVEVFRPNAAGTATAILYQQPNETSHYDKVDEETTDDATTFVYTLDAPAQLDTYNLPASTGSGTISKVALVGRMRSAGPVPRVRFAVRTVATNYYGDSQDPNTLLGDLTWGYLTSEWATNPNTSAAWTWAQIDALEIGLELLGGNGVPDWPNSGIDCSQLFAEVEYTPIQHLGFSWTEISSVNGVAKANVTSINGVAVLN